MSGELSLSSFVLSLKAKSLRHDLPSNWDTRRTMVRNQYSGIAKTTEESSRFLRNEEKMKEIFDECYAASKKRIDEAWNSRCTLPHLRSNPPSSQPSPVKQPGLGSADISTVNREHLNIDRIDDADAPRAVSNFPICVEPVQAADLVPYSRADTSPALSFNSCETNEGQWIEPDEEAKAFWPQQPEYLAENILSVDAGVETSLHGKVADLEFFSPQELRSSLTPQRHGNPGGGRRLIFGVLSPNATRTPPATKVQQPFASSAGALLESPLPDRPMFH
jgi:hypothetical protein